MGRFPAAVFRRIFRVQPSCPSRCIICFRVHRFSAPKQRYPTSRCLLLNARVRRYPPRHIFQRVGAVRSSRPGATGGKYSGRPNLDRVRGLAALEDEDLKKQSGEKPFLRNPRAEFFFLRSCPFSSHTSHVPDHTLIFAVDFYVLYNILTTHALKSRR